MTANVNICSILPCSIQPCLFHGLTQYLTLRESVNPRQVELVIKANGITLCHGSLRVSELGNFSLRSSFVLLSFPLIGGDVGVNFLNQWQVITKLFNVHLSERERVCTAMELFKDDIVVPLTIQLKFKISSSIFRGISPHQFKGKVGTQVQGFPSEYFYCFLHNKYLLYIQMYHIIYNIYNNHYTILYNIPYCEKNKDIYTYIHTHIQYYICQSHSQLAWAVITVSFKLIYLQVPFSSDDIGALFILFAQHQCFLGLNLFLFQNVQCSLP